MRTPSRNCLIVLIAVAITAPLNTARADTPPENTEMFRRLNDFHTLYRRYLRPEARDTATATFQVLKAAADNDPSIASILRYYIAECAFVAGNSPLAGETVEAIPDNPNEANSAEAARLLFRMMLFSQRSSNEEYFQATQLYDGRIARIFPGGSVADRISMVRKPPPANASGIRETATECFIIHPAHDDRSMSDVGAMYFNMHFYRSSAAAYHRSIGFMSDDQWISPVTAKIWQKIGNCHQAIGEWKEANSFYYKSIASGGSLEELVPLIREMTSNIRAGKPAPAILETPEPETLEKIARYCAGTQLYDDAFSAAELAEKYGRSNAMLLADIHRSRAEALQNLINLRGEGRVFRGTFASKQAVEADLQRADELSQQLPLDD